jgi:hypothetical protein
MARAGRTFPGMAEKLTHENTGEFLQTFSFTHDPGQDP